jgi:ABC-2 type transport system ATP-binding protein
MSLRVSALAHRYGAEPALRGVSFEVKKGEVLGYLGPNGAGKSTTIKCLLGLIRADEGEIRVAGIDVRQDAVEVRRRVGYLPEIAALYEGLTPVEHARFIGRLRGLADDAIEKRLDALLGAFELTERRHDPVREFSKGMRQKVGLSLALLHGPDVLLLDEPLSGLDATAARIVKELVRGYAASGGAVLYCSHVLDVVERVCDRVVILDRGAIVAEGSVDELMRREGDRTLDSVFQRVVDRGRDPVEIARNVVAELRP